YHSVRHNAVTQERVFQTTVHHKLFGELVQHLNKKIAGRLRAPSTCVLSWSQVFHFACILGLLGCCRCCSWGRNHQYSSGDTQLEAFRRQIHFARSCRRLLDYGTRSFAVHVAGLAFKNRRFAGILEGHEESLPGVCRLQRVFAYVNTYYVANAAIYVRLLRLQQNSYMWKNFARRASCNKHRRALARVQMRYGENNNGNRIMWPRITVSGHTRCFFDLRTASGDDRPSAHSSSSSSPSSS
ncbi:hypothetical protein ALC53_07043, partial [Atta colombica]